VRVCTYVRAPVRALPVLAVPLSDEHGRGAHYIVDMRGDARAGHAVNMQRHGRRIAAILQPMNAAAAASHERHRALPARLRAFSARTLLALVPFENRFAQRAVDHRVSAPCVMRMHGARLMRLPDKRGDRIAAVRIGGEQMTAVVLTRSFALRGRQQRGVRSRFRERDTHAAREEARMRRLGKLGARFEHGVERIAQAGERRGLSGARRQIVRGASLCERIEEGGGGSEVVSHGR